VRVCLDCARRKNARLTVTKHFVLVPSRTKAESILVACSETSPRGSAERLKREPVRVKRIKLFQSSSEALDELNSATASMSCASSCLPNDRIGDDLLCGHVDPVCPPPPGALSPSGLAQPLSPCVHLLLGKPFPTLRLAAQVRPRLMLPWFLVGSLSPASNIFALATASRKNKRKEKTSNTSVSPSHGRNALGPVHCRGTAASPTQETPARQATRRRGTSEDGGGAARRLRGEPPDVQRELQEGVDAGEHPRRVGRYACG